MKLYALLALAPLAVAQSITPAPTTAWPAPPWATNDPAKWSSVYASLVSEGKIPSTLTAPPWPTGSWGPGQGPPWGPGGGPGPGHGPGGRHWGGPSGSPPWGSDYGPWGWSTRSDWRGGPWTAWWDGSACPGTDWPGWTAGPWSTAAPWTTWSGCKAATTVETVVSSVSGGVVTSTRVAVKVEAADGTPAAGGSTAGGPRATAGVVGVVGAVVAGVVGVL